MPKVENPKRYSALPVTDVAELLGVTPRQVRNWITDKGLPAKNDPRGRLLDWPTTLQWFVDYRIAENSGNGGSRTPKNPGSDPLESMEQALARKTRAEADLKELQLARERCEVASISDVERTLSAANASTKTLILAFPSRLSTQLISIDDRAKLYAILERECKALLGNLASIDGVLQSRSAQKDEDE
jgi:phage terminase Nu1 subunit (DNA packaging protein)